MKNVMFDLYGTLIDIHTDEEKDAFWDRLASKYNLLDARAFKRKYMHICQDLLTEYEEIEILDVFRNLFPNENAEEVADYFRRISTEYEKLYRGVKTLLRALKQDGYKVYILSNAQAAFTIPELKRLDIYEMFDGIAISSSYGVKKPNPVFFEKAMADFGIEPKDTIMVGNDYECDIQPAQKLGIRTVFIESNLTPENNVTDKLHGFNYKQIYSKIKALEEK